MKPIYRLIPIIILLCSALQIELWSQNNFNSKNNTVSGIIINSETGEPIPHVEVFISGTTFGTITNANGEYSLEVPFLPCTFVASHVSYDSYIVPIENSKNNFNIKLTPSNHAINEVRVASKNKRKRNLRFFYSHFIPENSNEIKILNDSVLIFERTKTLFKAYSYEPIILINNYLGYKIKLILEEFSVIGVDGPNGNPVSLNSINGGEIIQLSGYYFYEPLPVSEKINEDFNYNRRLTYYGTSRHFLKSVYDNELEKQGYEIVLFPSETDNAFTEIKNEDSSFSGKIFVIKADSMKINFYFDDNKMPIDLQYLTDRFYFHKRESMIYPTKKPFMIRNNGTSPKLIFVVDGPLALKNFANSLPEDYNPPGIK